MSKCYDIIWSCHDSVRVTYFNLNTFSWNISSPLPVLCKKYIIYNGNNFAGLPSWFR